MSFLAALTSSRWSRRFTMLGSSVAVQALVQALSATAGLVLVRTLEKQQYAWFTITLTMSSALSMLSNAGIGVAVTSFGGRVWEDRPRLSGLIRAALRLRWILTLIAVAITAPWTIWLLAHNGAPLPKAIVFTAFMVAPVWAIGTTAIFGAVNKLHSRLVNLQVTELAGAMTKLVLVVVPALLAVVNVTWALVAIAVSFFVQAWMTSRQVRPLLDLTNAAAEADHYLPQIKNVVRHMYANSLFLCVQGQLATWLISIFGSSSKVADLGALGRLAILFAIIGTPIVQVISPTFARCSDMWRLRRLFFAGLAGYVICVLAIVLIAVWRGELLLWILGGKYTHLQAELVLVLIGFAISGVTSFFWSLNLSRGWVSHIWWNIPLSLLAQALALCLLDLSTVRGAAWLGIVGAVTSLGHAVFVSLHGFYQRATRTEA